MTRSEAFVYELSKNGFMSLWTYANPAGKDQRKELCDVLVVCEPDIVIFSVKEIEVKTDGDPATQRDRWIRRAVEESVEQISGAERRIAAIDNVTAANGVICVRLGARANRRVHRIAVAIGSGGSVPLSSRDFGRGFVHVFDESDVFHVPGNSIP